MTYSSEVLADSPRAFWLLDETSGTSAADASGNGRTLTYSGAVLAQPGLHAGSTYSARGTATGQGVGSIAYSSGWMSMTAFTVSGWYAPTALGDIVGVFSQYSAGGWVLWQRRNKIGIVALSPAQQEADGPLLTINKAHHLAVRLSAGVLDMFVDGVKSATITLSGTFTTTPDLQFGGYGGGSPSLAKVDGLAYWNTALSDARIAAHYAAGAPARDTTPVAHYKLDETSGTTMADSSGNGYAGTYKTGVTLAQTPLRAGSTYSAKAGASGLATVPGGAGSVFDVGEFTIIGSVLASSTTSDRGVLSRWGYSPTGVLSGFILYQNAGTINIYANGGTQVTGPAIDTTNPHRYAITCDGTTIKLYADGSFVGSAALTAPVFNALDFSIDGYNGNFYSQSTFDEVKWYRNALTAAEIATEYAGSTPATGTVAGTSPTGVGSVVGSVVVPTTGTVVGVSPSGVGAIVGTVPTTGTVAGTSPSGVGAIVGTAPTTGAIAGTSPTGVGSLVGDVPNFDVGGSVAGTSPSGAGAIVGTVPTVGTITGTSPSGVGALVGDVIVPTTGTIAGTSPTGVGSLAGSVYVPVPDTYYLSAPSPIGAALTSFEVYVPAPEVLFLSAPSPIGGAMRIHPVPAAVPSSISDRPIMARRHLMTPKTAANPRKMGDPLRARGAGSDGYVYPIEESVVGRRFRVFASGVDITHLAGVPTTLHEWSFAKPFGPQAASLTVPLPEWNKPGHGPYKIFWGDASIEIALEDSEGHLHFLWEGYTGEESDTAAPGQTGVTFNCEGTFQQAAHWLMDPPAVASDRDAGHVIADLLNAVPNRRWHKIKRFTTGHMVTTGGDSGQSVLARVAEIIGETFDDDNNQLGLHRRAPYVYELGWNNSVDTADWTFTKGSPGFASTLARPHNARRDLVFARGIAPDGGFWMGRHFPGLASSTPPVYPMAGFASMSVGTRDSDTVGGHGVSTWQRRMRELGYPVTVDGVMNTNDTKWVVEIQRKRGIADDGSLGPQTWSATWEGGNKTPETETVRLPLDVKIIAREYDRDASGAIIRRNPEFIRNKILHAVPEIDAGTNMKKSTFIPLARQIRYREASPGYVGTLAAEGVDPQEVDSSRLFITAGDNVLVEGHHDGTIVQVSDVTHTPTSTRMTVDSGARGQAVVDAVITRQRDARRSLSGKATKITDRGTLNASQLGQYESESPAGKYSRTAINGDSGLWTVRCIYVAEQGLARFRLTSSPNAEIITLICGKRITANQVAAICPDPLSDDSGWYDAVEKLEKKFALVNVAGTPGDPGGYWPKQKGKGPLTGVQAAGNLSMKSQRGGFFWVAVYTSRSTFVEGEFEPEVSTA